MKFMHPLVIAEISGNHNGSLENCLKLVNAAKMAGCDGIKLQTFKPDQITLDANTDEFKITGGRWNGFTLFQLYTLTHTPWDWHIPIRNLCRSLGLIFFSSPFHESAVDFLVSIGVDRLKIASPEIIHLPLIAHCSKTALPLIISTGMAGLQEISNALQIAQKYTSDITLLKCTSSYPADLADMNLNGIKTLQREFNCKVGLSDHSISPVPAIVATSMGAVMIEKHITFDRADGGIDSHFSSTPSEIEELVKLVRQASVSLGSPLLQPVMSESIALPHRRSVYSTLDIPKGTVVTDNMLKCIRPGFGEKPEMIQYMIGRIALRNIKFAQPVFITDFQ